MDLETRLVALGDHLDLDDGHGVLSDRVLARIDTDETDAAQIERDGRQGRWLRYAAAVLLLATVVAVAVPAYTQHGSGFVHGRVRIERRQDIDTPDEPSTSSLSVDGDVSGLPSPGGSREVTVDGRVVLVSGIEGALTDDVIVKTLGPDTDIVEVTVGNAQGLWITGAPHELAYLSPDGTIAFEQADRRQHTALAERPDDWTAGRLDFHRRSRSSLATIKTSD